jgi:hypothetical protein
MRLLCYYSLGSPLNRALVALLEDVTGTGSSGDKLRGGKEGKGEECDSSERYHCGLHVGRKVEVVSSGREFEGKKRAGNDLDFRRGVGLILCR